MVRMIGAMPALAVRQQRRHVHHDDHNKPRPSTLTIDANLPHLGLSTPLRSPRVTPHTSPIHYNHLSPKIYSKGAVKLAKTQKSNTKKRYRGHKKSLRETWLNGHIFGCISLLRISVLSLLVGIILLVVGLVQLAPGASLRLNKYAFIGAGLGLLSSGFIILIILCICQKKVSGVKESKKKQEQAANKKKIGRQKSDLNCSVKDNQIGVETVDGTMTILNGSKGPRTPAFHPAQCHPPMTDYKLINEAKTGADDNKHKSEQAK